MPSLVGHIICYLGTFYAIRLSFAIVKLFPLEILVNFALPQGEFPVQTLPLNAPLTTVLSANAS